MLSKEKCVIAFFQKKDTLSSELKSENDHNVQYVETREKILEMHYQQLHIERKKVFFKTNYYFNFFEYVFIICKVFYYLYTSQASPI